MEKPVYQGTIRECLAHFSRENWPKFDKKQRNYLLNDYFGFPNESFINSWADNKDFPKGLFLVKAIFLLNDSGEYGFYLYQITEIKNLPKTVLDIIKILAFNQVTAKEVTKKIGYKENDSLYKILFGKTGCSKRVLEEMKKIVDLFGSQKTPNDPAEEFAEKTLASTEDSRLLVGLINIIDNSCGLLERPIEKFLKTSTIEERQNLRNLLQTKEQGIFQISNKFFRFSEMLNALCSEKALSEFNQKNK